MEKDTYLAFELLRTIDKEQLRHHPTVIDLILRVGLHDDENINYRYGNRYQKYLKTQGMLQIPEQLTSALVYLSDFNIKKYLEIGTFNSLTTIFIVTYLRRFNEGITAITVDNLRELSNPFSDLNLKQIRGTSDDILKEPSDLCFIDGDHSYEWAKKDWNNVGKYAKICMFHDIVEEVQGRHETLMEVPRLWGELKRPESKEFIQGGYLGIGIL